MSAVCAVGECTLSYMSTSSLRTHQRKKHEDVYKLKGLQMRKKARINEISDSTIATFVKPTPVIETPPRPVVNFIDNNDGGVNYKLKTFEASLQITQELIAQEKNTRNEDIATIGNDMSGMMAQMINLQEQMTLVAKKTTKWCVICFEKENNYAFLPCGHKCVCKDCADSNNRSRGTCPICRHKIAKIQPIYDISAWDNN